LVALAHDSGRTQDLRATESRHEKTRRPVRMTNPVPWRFKMARNPSQNEVQGADFAPFAAGFEVFPLRVGVLDLVQSTACGPARRFCGETWRPSDSGFCVRDLPSRFRNQKRYGPARRFAWRASTKDSDRPV
jgi:hypothetical protein